MNDRPLSALAHPNRDRLHHSSAICFAISWLDIQVNAMQAVGAMVTVFRSRARANNSHPASTTSKPSATLYTNFSRTFRTPLEGGWGVISCHPIGTGRRTKSIRVVGTTLATTIAPVLAGAAPIIKTQLCFFSSGRQPGSVPIRSGKGNEKPLGNAKERRIYPASLRGEEIQRIVILAQAAVLKAEAPVVIKLFSWA